MANTISVMTNALRNVVSKKRIRYKENGFNLDLAYISDNIIAMGYPADNIEGIYRNRIDDVYQFFEENHRDHYKIYNLCSERSYDITKFHNRVATYPFADHNPPSIELIQNFCDDVDGWLKMHTDNVVAIHCKAGKGRTGTMICCYLVYSGFKNTAHDSLAYYDEKRTIDRRGVTIPSQRRYVDYFSKIIRNRLQYERRTFQICEIHFSSAPFMHSPGSVQCNISALQDPSSPEQVQLLQTLTVDFRKTLAIEIKDRCLPLTGDVKIEVYQKVMRKKYFHFWFNTYFLQEDGEEAKVVFEKRELDDAHKDREHKNFAEDFKVTLVLKPVPISRNHSYINDVAVQSNHHLVNNTSGITSNQGHRINHEAQQHQHRHHQQQQQQQQQQQNSLQLNHITTNTKIYETSLPLSTVSPLTSFGGNNDTMLPISEKNNKYVDNRKSKPPQPSLPPPPPPPSQILLTNKHHSQIYDQQKQHNHNMGRVYNNDALQLSENQQQHLINNSTTTTTTATSTATATAKTNSIGLNLMNSKKQQLQRQTPSVSPDNNITRTNSKNSNTSTISTNSSNSSISSSNNSSSSAAGEDWESGESSTTTTPTTTTTTTSTTPTRYIQLKKTQNFNNQGTKIISDDNNYLLLSTTTTPYHSKKQMMMMMMTDDDNESNRIKMKNNSGYPYALNPPTSPTFQTSSMCPSNTNPNSDKDLFNEISNTNVIATTTTTPTTTVNNLLSSNSTNFIVCCKRETLSICSDCNKTFENNCKSNENHAASSPTVLPSKISGSNSGKSICKKSTTRSKFMNLIALKSATKPFKAKKLNAKSKKSSLSSSSLAATPASATSSSTPIACGSNESRTAVKNSQTINIKKNKNVGKFHWLQNYFKTDPEFRENLVKSVNMRKYNLDTISIDSDNFLMPAITTKTRNTSETVFDHDDYYSSICDTQLSFNNSPCKSPRSMSDIMLSKSTENRFKLGKTSANIDDRNCVVVAKPIESHLIGFNVPTAQCSNIETISIASEKQNIKPIISLNDEKNDDNNIIKNSVKYQNKGKTKNETTTMTTATTTTTDSCVPFSFKSVRNELQSVLQQNSSIKQLKTNLSSSLNLRINSSGSSGSKKSNKNMNSCNNSSFSGSNSNSSSCNSIDVKNNAFSLDGKKNLNQKKKLSLPEANNSCSSSKKNVREADVQMNRRCSFSSTSKHSSKCSDSSLEDNDKTTD